MIESLKAYWRYWAFKFLIFTVTMFCALVVAFAFISNGITHISDTLAFAGAIIFGLCCSISEQQHQKRHDEMDALDKQIQDRRVAELKFYAEERAKKELHHLTIETDVPSKWQFIDREKRKCYVWQNGALVEATNVHVN